MGEKQDPPSKRARTQIKTVIREKREPKLKTPKTKKASRPKKSRPVKDSPPPSERRRSGRAHKVSVYTERDEEEDEEEMLAGVTKWKYGDDSESDSQAQGSESELSDAPEDDGEAAGSDKGSDNEGASELEEDEPKQPESNGQDTTGTPKGKAAPKPAAKASAPSETRRPARATRSRRGKDAEDMDIDANE
jgi:sister-chromatid-cohesion protein PDS5